MIFCLHFTPLSSLWIIRWSLLTFCTFHFIFWCSHSKTTFISRMQSLRTCKEQQLWIPVFAERLIFANLSKLQFCMELFEKLPTSLSRQKVYRISLFHIQTSKPFFCSTIIPESSYLIYKLYTHNGMNVSSIGPATCHFFSDLFTGR